MPYLKKVKIKGQDYYYLFHTVRSGKKYLKESKYLGKELPKNIEQLKEEFLQEIKSTHKSKHSKLIESLTSLERKILPLLRTIKKSSTLIKESNLQEVEVLRALQWLQNKNLIETKKTTKELIILDKNGELYLKQGLPERKFLKALTKPLTLEEIQKKANLEKDEINVCLGLLKKRNLIQLGEKITRLKEEDSILKLAEEFLKSLPLDPKTLSEERLYIFHEFKKRREILKEDLTKDVEINLSQLGEELSKENLKINLIETLTSDMLRTGSYKNKRFRRYDVKINVPKIYSGRRHFVNQAIDYSKRIWLDLGFKEMEGNIINTSFWNFDALFTPQDHPARDLQDSIFLTQKGTLPKEFANKIKEMHEHGDKNSKGWQYKWDEEKAKKLVMRTHTTVLSALTLSKLKKEDLPAKFFAIGNNFRNETVDWSHSFEFEQTEGIVIDPNLNFKHLLGYLREFFNKMGFEKVRFRPAFFPYVNIGTEVDIYHPIKKKWIELGGAGIFRQEVTTPLLGKPIPVLAWGLGIGRILMDYYELNDLRDLKKNDVKQLREIKAWLK
ncbi:phenylalanine--tRNA ligase subunit alpha [Candidatus Woesearchaeota archaeon]|nr:phenylalanine--tRNA ligase subunit alpha [Candidatus Woesearchaeota archaeon]